jgi:predicted lipoprotein with Yx(FWY)xxD motif
VRNKLAICLIAIVMALAACGGDDDDSTSAGDSSAGQSSDQGGTAALVKTGSTDLGDVLITADGMTVYGFTNDSGGTSTCEAGCATAWPPVLVDGETLPSDLDADVFSVVERSDDTYQLKAGDWPLYTFAGDTGPGDTNGEGSGGVWFVVKPDGQLQMDAAATATTEATGSDASSGGNGGY